MNAELLKKIKMIMESEAFKKISRQVLTTISEQILNKVSQRFKEKSQKREENMKDGMNRDQSFNHEKAEYEEIFDEYKSEFSNDDINWKDIAKNIFRNSFSFVEEKLNLKDSALFKNLKEYKLYLEEQISEEDEKVLINKLFSLIDGVLPETTLKALIGEDNYKELLTILIKHSMSVTRVVYNYALNRINEFQMKEKLQSLYEDYVLVVFDFVKNNPIVREHGLTVLNFAFGNKAAAVQSFMMTVAVNVFDGEKREEMANTFNKVKDKVKSWFGNVKSKLTRKDKESKYENYES